jgi:hypothetical protein
MRAELHGGADQRTGLQCMHAVNSGMSSAAGASRSSCWPPAMPACRRLRRVRARIGVRVRAAGAADRERERLQRIAGEQRRATSYATWHVGLPRRSESSSMHGRSSWISEYAWIELDGRRRASRRRRIGAATPTPRTQQRRMPLAAAERCVAHRGREPRAGASARGSNDSSTPSIRCWRSRDQAANANASGVVGIAGREAAAAALLEHLTCCCASFSADWQYASSAAPRL